MTKDAYYTRPIDVDLLVQGQTVWHPDMGELEVVGAGATYRPGEGYVVLVRQTGDAKPWKCPARNLYRRTFPEGKIAIDITPPMSGMCFAGRFEVSFEQLDRADRVGRRKAIDQRFTRVDGDIKSLSKDIDKRCGTQCGRIDGLEKNNLELQLKIEHVPTHQDIKELSERITTLHGTLSELNGRLGGINRAVDLLNEYHLKPGGEGRQ